MAEQELSPTERLQRIAALHQPITEGINEGFCCGCEDAWPCPTRRLAHFIPSGEGGSDG